MSVGLSTAAEEKIQGYYQAMAAANGQDFQEGASFSVSPQVQDRIITEARVSLDILRKINYRTVNRNAGNVLSFHVQRGITGRGVTNKKTADNKRRQYQTDQRTFRWKIPFSDIDNWTGVANLIPLLSPLYLRTYLEEMIFIALRGVERHADPEASFSESDRGAQLKKVDRGWAKILETDQPSNILSEWKTGTGVILYGETRSVPVGGLTPESASSDAKTAIPLPAHGFVMGGMIHFREQTGYTGEYKVTTGTTKDRLVINKSFASGPLASSARVEQNADFANIGELIAVMKKSVPEMKRSTLEAWIGDDILASYEQKILASADPATPSEFRYMSQVLMSHGNLPSFGLPDFPDSEIWVVNPSILAVYELRGSRRREAKQDMDLSAYTDKTYVEVDNVVEDPEPFIIARNLRQIEAYNS